MASLKLLLDTRRVKADGTYNVIFRITHLRKVYTISSGTSLEEKFWDKHSSTVIKSHSNSKLIYLKLNKVNLQQKSRQLIERFQDWL